MSLPSGTVTFLFTDIEISTKFAQVFSMAWCVSTLSLVSQISKLLAPFCPQTASLVGKNPNLKFTELCGTP